MARSNTAVAQARTSSGAAETKVVRCAVYTRKSTEEGLQQEFNSLDAQREASEAFIASQKHEGWQVISDHFDDGGYTGAIWIAPHSSGSWQLSSRARLTASLYIRLTDSAGLCSTFLES